MHCSVLCVHVHGCRCAAAARKNKLNDVYGHCFLFSALAHAFGTKHRVNCVPERLSSTQQPTPTHNSHHHGLPSAPTPSVRTLRERKCHGMPRVASMTALQMLRVRLDVRAMSASALLPFRP